MIVTLTDVFLTSFVNVDVPMETAHEVEQKMAALYRGAIKPKTIAKIAHELGGKTTDKSGTCMVFVDQWKCRVRTPGREDFRCERYSGKPQPNIIPRYVPDLPRVVSGFSIKN